MQSDWSGAAEAQVGQIENQRNGDDNGDRPQTNRSRGATRCSQDGTSDTETEPGEGRGRARRSCERSSNSLSFTTLDRGQQGLSDREPSGRPQRVNGSEGSDAERQHHGRGHRRNVWATLVQYDGAGSLPHSSAPSIRALPIGRSA